MNLFDECAKIILELSEKYTGSVSDIEDNNEAEQYMNEKCDLRMRTRPFTNISKKIIAKIEHEILTYTLIDGIKKISKMM